MQVSESLCGVRETAVLHDNRTVPEPPSFGEVFGHPTLFSDNIQHEMEILSAASSLAALLALATSTVKSVYAFALSFKDFHQELTTLANEATQLLGILHTLKSSYSPPGPPTVHQPHLLPPSSGEATPLSITSSPSPISTNSDSDKDYEMVSARRTQAQLASQLVNEVATCHATLMEVDRFVSQLITVRGRSLSNFPKQFKWSLQKIEVQKLVDKLERHKATFVLILSFHSA